jgi:hypothetical protein
MVEARRFTEDGDFAPDIILERTMKTNRSWNITDHSLPVHLAPNV